MPRHQCQPSAAIFQSASMQAHHGIWHARHHNNAVVKRSERPTCRQSTLDDDNDSNNWLEPNCWVLHQESISSLSAFYQFFHLHHAGCSSHVRWCPSAWTAWAQSTANIAREGNFHQKIIIFSKLQNPAPQMIISLWQYHP